MVVVVPPGFYEFIMSLNEDEWEAVMSHGGISSPGIRVRSRRAASRARSLQPARVPKRRRKVSAYQREFGRQLKALKRTHPRTPVSKLMKRAHAATKRARRGKR